jgi:hypothetical protein
MTLSNLVSGLIGALVGGLFSLGGAILTIRHEQKQVRRGASHNASNAVMENIITIRKAMLDVQRTMSQSNDPSDPGIYSLLGTVQTAAQNTLYIYNALIADERLRSRISNLVDIVDVWYQNARESPVAVNQKRIESIESYTGYVIESIQAHLRGLPLPDDGPRPDMLATGKA